MTIFSAKHVVDGRDVVLRRSLSPKINFNFPTVKLPESTLKSISVASSLAAQDAWKQFG
jgi:hypothetical protein